MVMKYANLSYVSGTNLNSEVSRVNIGDYMQTFAIDALYEKIGIPYEDVYHITIEDMKNYRGEYLILPINFMFVDEAFCEEGKIAISDFIIPVFIGISLYRGGFTFNEFNINYLKRFSPIGCRDYGTYKLLQSYGIASYMAGCISLTFPYRKNVDGDTVYFVDVPEFIRDMIPKSYFEKSKFIHHEQDLTKELFHDLDYARNLSKALLQEYHDHAKLIITSRLHCASPCIGMGIPTIIIREYRGHTFDWIDQFVPVYQWEDRAEIDWYPKKPDLENEKRRILNTAIQRIQDAMNKLYYLKSWEIYPDYFCKTEEVGIEYSCFNEDKIRRKLQDEWKTQGQVEYALWGISDRAEKIYNYIQTHYTNAKLIKVIDANRNLVFHGIKSEKPEILKRHNNFYTIVTTINASNAAKEMFDRIGKPQDEYLLMADTFMDSI